MGHVAIRNGLFPQYGVRLGCVYVCVCVVSVQVLIVLPRIPQKTEKAPVHLTSVRELEVGSVGSQSPS